MAQAPDIMALDVAAIRKEFPILHREVNGKPLVYLDNGASSQKPQAMIDAVSHYYAHENTNIHRGVHTLSQEATEKYEAAREKVRGFINAKHGHEVIITKGTTDSINLVASSFGRAYLNAGDEVLISTMEHHSNIVPWQMICEERGATVRVVPINDAGELLMDEFDALLSKKTKLVAVTHISNSLGTINPVKQIIDKAHALNVPVLIDGAQAVPHQPVDMQALDCDFYAFSAHKMFGPTGIGILYGKESLLNAMPPYQGGGDMIDQVTFEKTTYNDLPHKFEAGTPNIAGGIALGAAIDYLNGIGMQNIEAYEADLLAYATEQLRAIDGLKIIGTAANKAGVISFKIDDLHHYDLGIMLDRKGIAIRTGHHCTQPLMQRLGVTGTARASLAFYNNRADVDALVAGIQYAKQRLS
jgi:cysteine desulfurase/selenocysteine lyase